MHLKLSSANYGPFCFCLNVITASETRFRWRHETCPVLKVDIDNSLHKWSIIRWINVVSLVSFLSSPNSKHGRLGFAVAIYLTLQKNHVLVVPWRVRMSQKFTQCSLQTKNLYFSGMNILYANENSFEIRGHRPICVQHLLYQSVTPCHHKAWLRFCPSIHCGLVTPYGDLDQGKHWPR